MTKKATLKVPVSYKKVIDGEILQQPGGMLHDTDYARGAQSRQEAADNWDSDMARVGHNRWSVEYVMEVLPPFRTELHLLSYHKNRSSAYMIFTDRAGNFWPMFLGDVTELFSSANMKDGWLEEFEYEAIKRGIAYGIRRVK